jgi:RHS repeat-associated protein
VSKSTGSQPATYFAYDISGHLIGGYNAAGTLVREIVWLGDVPIAEIFPNQSPYFIAPDHLNAPMALIGPSPQAPATPTILWSFDPDPFGNGTPRNPTGAVGFNLRFPGQFADGETGLNYNGARDYDPTSGRYIESDPIGLGGGVNTYVYAGNNPLSFIDPFGASKNAAADSESLSEAFGVAVAMPAGDIGELFISNAIRAGITAAALPSAIAVGILAVTSTSTADPTLAEVQYVERAGAGAAQLHGNSAQSQNPTEVYYLVNRSTSAIDKIGITSNPSGRYSQSYLKSENVDYVTQTEYLTRYPAMVDENIRLTWYMLQNGSLPRLNKLTR